MHKENRVMATGQMEKMLEGCGVSGSCRTWGEEDSLLF